MTDSRTQEPTDDERLLWERFKSFEEENQALVRAMHTLNMTREEYLHVLSLLIGPSSNGSNTST